MHRFHFQRLGLCDEQTETPVTASGGEEIKLTIGQQLKAALSSKQNLTAQIAAHEGTIADHLATITAKDAEITQLKADIATRDAKITALEADAADVAAALEAHKSEVATLKATATTVEAKAKEKVAALGFPASKLPKADDKLAEGSADEQIASLNRQIEASKDPKEKGRLANQVWDLMNKRGLGQN